MKFEEQIKILFDEGVVLESNGVANRVQTYGLGLDIEKDIFTFCPLTSEATLSQGVQIQVHKNQIPKLVEVLNALQRSSN